MFYSGIFGTINPPPSVVAFGNTGGPGGLTILISNVIKSFILLVGIFGFVNIILAGYKFISGGSDPKNISEAWSKVYMSILGLAVVAASFLITGVASLIIFGDAKVLFSPTIYGPQ